MGFSQSTRQYKLFRFSSDDPSLCYDRIYSYLDVYTLGDDIGSWRRHPRKFLNSVVYHIHSPPPALVDGKLYVLTEQPGMVPDMLLVIDVASEAHFTYSLPYKFKWGQRANMYLFEMCGRLCVAVCFLWHSPGQHLLHFWVMQPLGLKDKDGGVLHHVHGSWEQCYTGLLHGSRW
jgi:hypothetical protein